MRRSFRGVSPHGGADAAGGAARRGEEIRELGVRAKMDSRDGEQVQRGACERACGGGAGLLVAWMADRRADWKGGPRGVRGDKLAKGAKELRKYKSAKGVSPNNQRSAKTEAGEGCLPK